MNIEGSAISEAVLLDPETIKWMASQDDARGDSRPRLFGHTREINLQMMQIEVATGKPMKRPLIPGLEMRKNRKIKRTKDAVAAALERSRNRQQST
jgi:hypothetical protein